jgi:hypothetical protein
MANTGKKTESITSRKKMIAAVNKLLKDHNFSGFKVLEINLEPKSPNAITQDCNTIVCTKPGQKIIKVVKGDGTIECICWPR